MTLQAIDQFLAGVDADTDADANRP
jgi:hypothetical protein